MKSKEKIYALGSAVCFAAIASIVFYLIKVNINDKNAVQQQNSFAQTANSPSLQSQPALTQAPADQASSNIQPADVNIVATQETTTNGDNGKQTRGMANIPAGSKPFFGQITAIDGTKITMGKRDFPGRQQGATNTQNAAQNSNVIVVLTDNTTFAGGDKTNLAVGTKIAGYGTVNSDSSINATNLQINPQMPAGFGKETDKQTAISS